MWERKERVYERGNDVKNVKVCVKNVWQSSATSLSQMYHYNEVNDTSD